MINRTLNFTRPLIPIRSAISVPLAATPEKKVRLNVGSIGYDHKPNGCEVGAVVANLAEKHARVEVTLRELLHLVTEEGRPYTPALLDTPLKDGSIVKCNDCFTSQQIFALDFDNKDSEIVSLETTLSQAAELDLNAFGAYFTPSHTEAIPKYRLLFCLERPITNERERQIIMKMLLDLFPSADPNCKDAARHFYGVKTGPVQHALLQPCSVISVEALTLAWQSHLAEDKAHFSDKMKRFATKYGLRLCNGRLYLIFAPPPTPGKSGESVAHSMINNIEPSTSSPFGATATPPIGDNPDEDGGDFLGDFFHFTSSLEDFLRGKMDKTAHQNATNRPRRSDVQKNRERQQRWDKVREQLMQCELIQLLINNTDSDNSLSHGEFFHLATTFANLRGGDGVFEAALEASDYRSEKRIGQYRQIVASKCYLPQHCENSVCRFKQDCPIIKMPQHRSILSLKFGRGDVRQVKVPVTISIEEAREQMHHYYEAALESDKNISVIRADCGAGKTFAMIAAMIDQVRMSKKVVYAAPTHRLLNETHEQLRELAGEKFPIYRWPDLVQYIEQTDASLAEEIKHYWATGHHGQAAKAIWNWAHQQAQKNEYYHTSRSCLDTRGRDIQDYLAAKANADTNEPSLWLLTHARLVNAPMKADVVFIDEDILLRNLLTVRQFKLDDLSQLILALQTFACDSEKSQDERVIAEMTVGTLTNLFQQIWQTGKNKVTPMPSIDFPEAKLLRKVLPNSIQFSSDREEAEGKESDLLEFLTSRTVAFVRPQAHGSRNSEEVVYVSRRTLPNRVNKYVVASASVNPRLSEAFWGQDEVEFLLMPHIAYTGELFLHPEKSFASSSFRGKEKEKVLSRARAILEEHPDSAIICSKAVKKVLPSAQQNRVKCTFGATEGLNEFQGRDLLIVGALHRPDFVYKLIAVALGKKLGLDTTMELQYQQVSRGDYDFSAVAFDDELLQEIQFALIENDLEQAVGRARLVSHNCRVDLFTNIPLQQCKLAS